MSTRAEWSRYWRERAGPDKPPKPVVVKPAKPQKNWSKNAMENASYDWEHGGVKPSRKSTRRNRTKPVSWPQKRRGGGISSGKPH